MNGLGVTVDDVGHYRHALICWAASARGMLWRRCGPRTAPWLAAGHGPRMLDDEASWRPGPAGRKCLLLPKAWVARTCRNLTPLGGECPTDYGTAAKSGGNANEYSASRNVGNAPGINVRQ